MKTSIEIVAADDHQIFLEGLKSLFQLSAGHTLIACCGDGDSLLDIIINKTPDIALVDLSMPGATTEDIVNTVEKKNLDTQLIALTMHKEPELAQELLELGLAGYVLKEEAFDELSNAIQAVLQGEQFISPNLLKAIKNSKQQKDLLSRREIEVLQYAAEGVSNKKIAQLIGISERTVRFHVSNCCLKLDAHGRSHAIAKAVQMGLFEV